MKKLFLGYCYSEELSLKTDLMVPLPGSGILNDFQCVQLCLQLGIRMETGLPGVPCRKMIIELVSD